MRRKWKVNYTTYDPLLDQTQISLSEDGGTWQRLTADVPGKLEDITDEQAIHMAIDQFIQEERPDYANQLQNKKVSEIEEALNGTRDLLKTTNSAILDLANLVTMQRIPPAPEPGFVEDPVEPEVIDVPEEPAEPIEPGEEDEPAEPEIIDEPGEEDDPVE